MKLILTLSLLVFFSCGHDAPVVSPGNSVTTTTLAPAEPPISNPTVIDHFLSGVVLSEQNDFSHVIDIESTISIGIESISEVVPQTARGSVVLASAKSVKFNLNQALLSSMTQREQVVGPERVEVFVTSLAGEFSHHIIHLSGVVINEEIEDIPSTTGVSDGGSSDDPIDTPLCPDCSPSDIDGDGLSNALDNCPSIAGDAPIVANCGCIAGTFPLNQCPEIDHGDDGDVDGDDNNDGNDDDEADEEDGELEQDQVDPTFQDICEDYAQEQSSKLEAVYSYRYFTITGWKKRAACSLSKCYGQGINGDQLLLNDMMTVNGKRYEKKKVSVPGGHVMKLCYYPKENDERLTITSKNLGYLIKAENGMKYSHATVVVRDTKEELPDVRLYQETPEVRRIEITRKNSGEVESSLTLFNSSEVSGITTAMMFDYKVHNVDELDKHTFYHDEYEVDFYEDDVHTYKAVVNVSFRLDAPLIDLLPEHIKIKKFDPDPLFAGNFDVQDYMKNKSIHIEDLATKLSSQHSIVENTLECEVIDHKGNRNVTTELESSSGKSFKIIDVVMSGIDKTKGFANSNLWLKFECVGQFEHETDSAKSINASWDAPLTIILD